MRELGRGGNARPYNEPRYMSPRVTRYGTRSASKRFSSLKGAAVALAAPAAALAFAALMDSARQPLERRARPTLGEPTPAASFPSPAAGMRGSRRGCASPKRKPSLALAGHSSAFVRQSWPAYGTSWPYTALHRSWTLAEGAFGQAAKQIRQIRIAVLSHELRRTAAPAPAARLAHERQGWVTDVGQSERAVPGQPPRSSSPREGSPVPRPRGVGEGKNSRFVARS
jgi:hypothetical protein